MTIPTPNVHVQEIPGGARVVTGVATSITAFMGRAVCGPLGQADGPVTVFSFQDYERIFGGLSHDSPMSYAVRDFFINGGSQAVVVRLFEQVSNPAAFPPPPPDESPLDHYSARFYVNAPPLASPPFAAPLDPPAPPLSGSLRLRAASPGTWGNRLAARVDLAPPSVAEQVLTSPAYAALGVRPTDPLFNLTVYYNPPSGVVQSERFTNLMVTGGEQNPNRIDNVLENQSRLARYAGALPAGNAPNPLSPDWSAGWQAFDDDLAKSGVSEATLFSVLPGPHGQGGAPAPADSALISSQTYAADGVRALDRVDLFNLLSVPPDFNDTLENQDATAVAAAAALVPYCARRRAVMILDPLHKWMGNVNQDRWEQIQPTDYELGGGVERNAVVYFPRVVEADPLDKNEPVTVAPSGIIAGIIAATDQTRGVWKAPAGIDAGLNNILRLEYDLTNEQNGMLNPLGINCLRTFPTIGSVVWGARTLRGADVLEDDYKYLNVRRLALYVEESLDRGTRWAAFEPNDAVLWGALTTSVNAFLAGLQRQGAFYSFFVRCDATTTTPADVAQGVVNITAGIAPVEPAEFIVITIRQQALPPSP